MSTLTTFRDHCRAMTTAEHAGECEERLATWERAAAWGRLAALYDGIPQPGPRPTCDGCITTDDRALWTRLADEIDEHLAPQPDLFGGVSDEPMEDEA